MKVKITIEFDLTLTPPSSSKLESEEALEPVQTTIEDFTTEPEVEFVETVIREGTHRDSNHMRRKFIYKCSICGLVGYNARSHPDHFSE